MSSQSIVCASCSAAVPYGRLSCPSCGELLASVAGAARRVPVERPAAAKRSRAARGATATAAVAATTAIPASTVASATAPAPAAATAFPAAATPAYLPRPARAMPSVLADVAAPVDATPVTETATTDDAGWDAPDTTATEPGWTEDASWNGSEPSSVIDDEPQWPSQRPATPSAAPASAIDEQIQASMSLPYVLQPVSPPPGAIATPPVAPAPVATAPGAYVPPVVGIDPAGPPAPARAWAGHAADTPTSDAAGRASAAAGALIDAARLPEFIGWLAVAGSAMAAVGFLLPWGASIIGASGIDYFDRWGMAGPFHPIVVLALLGILVLALVRNPIPLWVRVGLPGLGLGALLLGLGWPYLVALPGRGPGVLVVALGAILLIVAGIMALVTDRHAEADQAV